MELIIISGYSGAGKSIAVHALEDIDYYCIDNLPPALISDFVSLCRNSGEINKVAIVTDIRGG
ncbi:MAG: RNase adapter RapZ, partial [Acutalibacteraceae bacterium]